MKKQKIMCLCMASLLTLTLAACGEKNNIESPSPSERAEHTQSELYQQFETVYDNCGGSFSQEAEQLTIELSALASKAEADEKEWSEDYEALYKAWRADTIVERSAALQTDYEQILEERELYEIGVEGLWETRPGLVYADQIDAEQDEKPELLLLTWLGYDEGEHKVRVELYHEEKGHADECLKRDISFGAIDANISLAEYEGQIYLSVYHEDGGSSGSTQASEFYAMNKSGIQAADAVYYTWERDRESYDTMKITDGYYSLQEDNTYTEITQEEYNQCLEKYEMGERLVDFGMAGSNPNVRYTGILPAFEVPVPKVEVNGNVLELEVAPYAYNGEVMVPLRDVLEAMGIAVYAKVESPRVAIFASTKSNSLYISNYGPVYGRGYVSNEIGSFDTYENDAEGNVWGDLYDRYGNEYYYYFDGSKKVKVTVQNRDGKVFVPISIFSLFGNAEWDNESKTLRISSNIAPENQMSQSDLQKIANFSFETVETLIFDNGYQVKPHGSAGGYDAMYKIAFGASSWKFNAEYRHTTYGVITAYSNGTFEYKQLGEIGPEDLWQ